MSLLNLNSTILAGGESLWTNFMNHKIVNYEWWKKCSKFSESDCLPLTSTTSSSCGKWCGRVRTVAISL